MPQNVIFISHHVVSRKAQFHLERYERILCLQVLAMSRKEPYAHPQELVVMIVFFSLHLYRHMKEGFLHVL